MNLLPSECVCVCVCVCVCMIMIKCVYMCMCMHTCVHACICVCMQLSYLMRFYMGCSRQNDDFKYIPFVSSSIQYSTVDLYLTYYFLRSTNDWQLAANLSASSPLHKINQMHLILVMLTNEATGPQKHLLYF